ncbi:S-adenosyl-L-methionine-dependent methyltransferase [Jimgerdemannia flammicorona]|uniref:S-adenosyl-L-methionine-dependent methyltransferase n=1 Tax=Jimgerdemannia flammicorona TaxID=994334 RepID=A0A433Q1V9_9FUNG|nr:S-adenosyl-L-methionine-dependent methyltransferase [Jimgerdemannia flammicorona]
MGNSNSKFINSNTLTPSFHKSDSSDTALSNRTEDRDLSTIPPYSDDSYYDERKANFRFQDGRRYHGVKGIASILPNDDREMDRLSEEHYMVKLAFDGCGPGVWMLDCAHDYPESNFLGIDISPVFPISIKPKNTEFMLGNIVEGLPFSDNTFDFVFARLLYGFLTDDDWNLAIKEYIRVTKPGGYIELVECDSRPYRCGPRFKRIMTQGCRAMEARLLKPYIGPKLSGMLEEAGLIKINSNFSSIPINWGGPLGDIGKSVFCETMKSLKPWLTKVIDMSPDIYDTEIQEAIKEAGEFKAYFNMYYAFGQKSIEA